MLTKVCGNLPFLFSMLNSLVNLSKLKFNKLRESTKDIFIDLPLFEFEEPCFNLTISLNILLSL